MNGPPPSTGRGLWAVAGWARLRFVGLSSTGSDALGQYLAAWSASWNWVPGPPNPEGGHSLWVMALPLVHLAGSLETLFKLRFIVGALIAPLAAAAVLLLLPHGLLRWVAALLVGLILSFDPGLIDTLVISFRGYGAPEMGAMATLGLALVVSGHRVGLLIIGPAVVAAAGQHPMGAGLGLGILCVLVDLGALVGWRWVAAGGLIMLLTAVPRVLFLIKMSRCGEDVLTCLSGVALSSAESEVGNSTMLRRAFHDRFVVETDLHWVGLLLGLGCLFVLVIWIGRKGRDAFGDQQRGLRIVLLWALGATVGVLCTGLAVDSLRPYHLRIVAAPLVVAAVVGWMRLSSVGASANRSSAR